jgi:signal transduction histidine kinase
LELKFEPQGVDDDMEIYGDSGRTYQILSNILSNAIKFTMQGSITIVLSIEERFVSLFSLFSLSLSSLSSLLAMVNIVRFFFFTKAARTIKLR